MAKSKVMKQKERAEHRTIHGDKVLCLYAAHEAAHATISFLQGHDVTATVTVTREREGAYYAGNTTSVGRADDSDDDITQIDVAGIAYEISRGATIKDIEEGSSSDLELVVFSFARRGVPKNEMSKLIKEYVKRVHRILFEYADLHAYITRTLMEKKVWKGCLPESIYSIKNTV